MDMGVECSSRSRVFRVSPHLLAVVEDQALCDVVHGQREGSPPGDGNGEHAHSDGQQGDDDIQGGGDGTHYVGPHTYARRCRSQQS